jgi:hypothetical protein
MNSNMISISWLGGAPHEQTEIYGIVVLMNSSMDPLLQ